MSQLRTLMPLDAVEVTMRQLPVFVGGFAMTWLDSDLLCPAECVNVLNFYLHSLQLAILRTKQSEGRERLPDYKMTLDSCTTPCPSMWTQEVQATVCL